MKKALALVTAVAAMAMIVPAGASAAPTSAPAVKSAASDVMSAPDRILVKFKPGVAASEKANINKAFGAVDNGKLGAGKSEWHLVSVPFGKAEGFVTKYLNNPNVEGAELDYQMTASALPNDPGITQQYAYDRVQGAAAWDIITGSAGTRTVAVIDTGIDLTHEDLAGSLVPGAVFTKGGKSADDDNGHGTHCAGSVAGIGNNGKGISGMDQSAKLMPVKVLSKSGSGWTSDIINGVYFAADNGADVLSMSLGGGGFNQAFQDAINYAHNTKGAIVVAAAGNDGVSTPHYPSAYANVMSVAATDQNDAKTSWSNYGSTVDVAAPGLSIYSTWYDGGYNTISGTSMATPLVAGLVSLTWAKNPMATNQAVIDRIYSTADAISGTGTYWTHGRVNAYRAVNGF